MEDHRGGSPYLCSCGILQLWSWFYHQQICLRETPSERHLPLNSCCALKILSEGSIFLKQFQFWLKILVHISRPTQVKCHDFFLLDIMDNLQSSIAHPTHLARLYVLCQCLTLLPDENCTERCLTLSEESDGQAWVPLPIIIRDAVTSGRKTFVKALNLYSGRYVSGTQSAHVLFLAGWNLIA